MLDHVEPDGLGEWSALAHRHDVSRLDVLESRGAVHREVLVALLKPEIGHTRGTAKT